MLEGSQIPQQFAAEQRMDQIMGRLGSLNSNPSASGAIPSITDANGIKQDPKTFKAMVAMMQAQMFSEAFNNDDKDNKNDNAMSSFMQSMMMQNPATAASIYGNQNSMNPQMQQQMLMQSLMGSSSGINPQQMMQMQVMNSANVNFNRAQNSQMVMPVQGSISSDYGNRSHPINGHNHFHNGVDIAAQQGTVIRAPWEGTVVHVGYVEGFGANTVIVAHENQKQEDGKILYSVFGHNEKAYVKKGDRVRSGEIFATVGSDGHSTGPHLHWETRVAAPGVQGTEIFKQQLSYTTDPMSYQA